MVADVRASREIREIAPALVASLAAEGSLPQLPATIEAERAHAANASVEQIAAVRWFGAYDASGIVGILGVIERFDHHRLRNAIVIVHIAGSARAVRDLLLHLKAFGKPVIGEIAFGNVAMARALLRLGARATRATFEVDA